MESSPYSIHTEKVQISPGKVQLTGSLLLPESDAHSLPAIVFVHGAGDESREFCRPYAEHFASQGIAALIYDKRGTGQSQGNWRSCDFAALAEDAVAFVHFLQGHPRVDRTKVGLWGISEGGWIVPIAASQSPDVAFVIAVSAGGMDSARAETYRQQKMRAAMNSRLAQFANLCYWQLVLFSTALGRQLPSALIPQNTLFAFAVRTFDFQPLSTWQKVRQPILFIWGAQDVVVPPQESIDLIQQALKEAEHPDVTYQMFPDGDHGIRQNNQHLPAYFPLMISWVKSHTNPY